LEEEWGPAWRRNHKPKKTERSRRKKVVYLIGKLANKRNWTVDLALRFIQERYELAKTPSGQRAFPTPRSFCDYLQKQPKDGGMKGEEQVMLESNSYT
jgi:hypothetical protein